MKRMLLILVSLLLISSVAMADHISIYSDATGTSCYLGNIAGQFSTTATVIHKFTVGATGSLFDISVPPGTALFSFNTPYVPVPVVQPVGIALGYGQCLSGTIVLGTMLAIYAPGTLQIVPADGSVDGWRYAVGDEQSTRFPRAVLTFDAICAATPAAAGQKRVGLVVEFGRPADSGDGATPPQPVALCASVPTDATSTDVLAKAGELRTEKGLVCAVAGYPAKDFGGEVKEVSAEAKAADTPVTIAAPAAATATPAAVAAPISAQPIAETSSTSGGTVAAYVIAGLAVLALIGYLIVRSRRRADTPS